MADQQTRSEAKLKFVQTLSSPSCGGSITYACRIIGYSRQAVFDWRKDDWAFNKAVKEAIGEGKEGLADIAEEALHKRINEGDTTAIIFTLKSLRRDYYGDNEEYRRARETENKEEKGAPRTEKEAKLLMSLLSFSSYYQALEVDCLSDEEKRTLQGISKKVSAYVDGRKTESSEYLAEKRNEAMSE